MNYDKLCSDVLATNSSIRFASVYTKNGDVVGGGMSNNRESLLIPEEVTMSLYYSKHMFETRKNLSHIVGNEKYSMTEYTKVKMITIPLQDENLLLISIEPKSDHFKMINRILKMVENYLKQN